MDSTAVQVGEMDSTVQVHGWGVHMQLMESILKLYTQSIDCITEFKAK